MQIADLNNSKFVSVGSVSKSYGNQGEVLIKIFDEGIMEQLGEIEEKRKKDDFKERKETDIQTTLMLFIQFEQIYTPFFIESASQKGKNGWVVRFTTISDASHAEEIVGRNLFIADFQDEKSREDLSGFQKITTLIGYTIIDSNTKSEGKIVDVIEYPANICLSIELSESTLSDDKDLLIPFHPDLVVDIDSKKREVIMSIPNGLI